MLMIVRRNHATVQINLGRFDPPSFSTFNKDDSRIIYKIARRAKTINLAKFLPMQTSVSTSSTRTGENFQSFRFVGAAKPFTRTSPPFSIFDMLVPT